MCWSIERWGEMEEIRERVKAEREEAVRKLLDSVPERGEEARQPVPSHEERAG